MLVVRTIIFYSIYVESTYIVICTVIVTVSRSIKTLLEHAFLRLGNLLVVDIWIEHSIVITYSLDQVPRFDTRH
jgi:hypothetical protein